MNALVSIGAGEHECLTMGAGRNAGNHVERLYRDYSTCLCPLSSVEGHRRHELFVVLVQLLGVCGIQSNGAN